MKNSIKPKSVISAACQVMFNQYATTGTTKTAKPASKPTACMMRRFSVRWRFTWRISHASNSVLKAKFQNKAKNDSKIDKPAALDKLFPNNMATNGYTMITANTSKLMA